MTTKNSVICVVLAFVGLFVSSISAFAARTPGFHHGPLHHAMHESHARNSINGSNSLRHHGRLASRISRPLRHYAGRDHTRPIAAHSRGINRISANRIAEAVTSTEGAQWTGNASFYSGSHRTASGGFVGAATCAHRTLPFGTKVLVTNLSSGRQAVLTVNDRGPFVRGRIVDVSTGAAGMLGMIHSGVAQVRVQVIATASRLMGG